MPTITLTPRLLDTDTSLASLPPDRAVRLRNIVPYEGYTGLASGTVGIEPTLPAPGGRSRVVGGVADLAGQSIVRFVWNELGTHRLLRTFIATGVEVVLLQAPQIELVENDLICQVGVIGKYLGWLDREGVAYRLNMDVAGAGGYAAFTDNTFYRLALPVPLYAPTTNRTVLPGQVLNRIGNNDWQAAYRYGYQDNDVTVLSPYSVVDKATKANAGGSGLILKLPAAEQPGPLVQRIEFYVRKNTSSTWQRVKSLKRDASGNFPQDVSAGFSSPGFTWRGQTLGDALDTAEADKLVEALPMRCRALGVGDNRFFVGDNTEGYAPTSVELSAVVETTGQTFTVAQRPLYQLKGEQLAEDQADSVEAFADFILVSGTAGQPDARYVNTAYNEYLNAYFEVPNAKVFTYDQLSAELGRLLAQQGGDATISNITAFDSKGNVPYVLYALLPTVKSLATYQLGVEFVDYAGRSSGTLTSDAAVVSVPDLDLNTTTPATRRVRWTLAPPTPATAIPDWAVAYRIVWTPDQLVSAFRQVHVAEVLRLEKGGDAANPRFVDLASPGGPLWLDLTPLTAPGKGYVWSAESNDRVRIYESPTSSLYHDYKIIGQLGAYLQVDEPQPVAYTRMTRVQIYSPRESESDVYYNAGPSYPVVRTGGVATYSVLTDLLPTDVFLTTEVGAGLVGLVLQSQHFFPAVGGQFYKIDTFSTQSVPIQFTPYPLYNNYYDTTKDLPRTKKYGVYNNSAKREGVPLMNPMGTGGLPGFFEVLTDIVENTAVWLNDRGRPSTVLGDGPPLPALRETDVRWTGTYLPGSQINGLSAMEEDSVVTLGQERGRVVALRLAVQQQESGTVLLAVQANGWSSLYLGEALLRQPNGDSLNVDTSKVVGTVRGQAGDKGSVDAGSVVGSDGKVWAWSQSAKTLLRYDQSGVTDLCETFRCQALGRELAALNATRIVGGYDPEADVYVLTFFYAVGDGGVTATRTVGFSERGAGGRDKGFCGDYDYASACYATLGEYLYSFYGPVLFRHDPLAPRNTFYGILYRGGARVVPGGKGSKSWLSLAYYGTDAWDTPLLENEQEGGRVQRSKTLAAWATWKLGAWVVALRRDMVKAKYGPDAVLVTAPAQLLHMGYPLQSPWLAIDLEITSDKNVRLDALDVNFNMLSGQQAKPN